MMKEVMMGEISKTRGEDQKVRRGHDTTSSAGGRM